MDTWWEQVRPAGRASHRAQCWADMATSRGEPGRWETGARERQASAQLSLIQLHAVAMTPSSMDTPCASQTSGLTPCSAALFLSHRQAPPPLTQTHTQPHTPSYTPHTLLTHSSLTHTYPHILLTHHEHSHTHSHCVQKHRKVNTHILVITHKAHTRACINNTHRSTPITHDTTHTHIYVNTAHLDKCLYVD